MKKRLIAALVSAAILLPSVASAQGILGGVLGSGGGSAGGLLDSVGGAAGGLLAPVTGATSGGPVSLGVGGSGGLVSVGVGGSEPVGGISILGPSGIAEINLDLGDVGAGVTVGGPGLLDVDIRLPRGADGGDGGNGGNGGGNNGNNGRDGHNGEGGYGVIQRGGSTFGSTSTACANTNPNQLIALFQQSRPAGWRQARNIELVPLRICREIRNQVGAWLAANPQYHSLVGGSRARPPHQIRPCGNPLPAWPCARRAAAGIDAGGLSVLIPPPIRHGTGRLSPGAAGHVSALGVPSW